MHCTTSIFNCFVESILLIFNSALPAGLNDFVEKSFHILTLKIHILLCSKLTAFVTISGCLSALHCVYLIIMQSILYLSIVVLRTMHHNSLTMFVLA